MVAGAGAVALAGGSAAAASAAAPGADRLAPVNHIVVISQETHSSDTLSGGGGAVRGLSQAAPAHTKQVTQAGTPFTCLRQNDVTLPSPPLAATCTDTTTGTSFTSAFPNAPF